MLKFGPFPAQVNIGHVHFDKVSNGLFRYLGGPVSDSLNWLLIGGEVDEHPDTSQWGEKQKGATWFLKTSDLYYGWDGNRIVVLGGQRGEGNEEVFLWVPGATNGNGVFGTWQDVYAAYVASKARRRVIRTGDQSLTYSVPPGVYVFDLMTQLIGIENNVAVVSLEDGARFVGLQWIERILLIGNSTTIPPCTLINSDIGLTLKNAGIASLSSVPVFLLTSVDGEFINCLENASINNLGIQVGPNVQCNVTLFDSSCGIGGMQLGDVSSILAVTRYNEDCVVDVSGFAGTVTIDFPGNAQRVGTTAQRPTNSVPQGHMFFDTTLGKPIWRRNAGWVDANGASV
jgi:hypothetical protein